MSLIVEKNETEKYNEVKTDTNQLQQPEITKDKRPLVAEIDETYDKVKTDTDQLQQQIQITKHKIFRYYTLKRQSEAQLSKSDDEISIASTVKLSPSSKLKQTFFEQIMKLKIKDDSLITVLFPYDGGSRYGFNLVKTEYGKRSLEKCCLPHSIDTDHFKKEISQLSVQQLPEFIEQIQKNVDAYTNRENLVKKLKEIIDSRILLYHCLRYTEIEFTFKVYNTETKIRRSLTVHLNFDLLSVDAAEVICKINGTEKDEEMKSFFKEHFKIFTQMDLVSAYEEAFQNVDKYNFFV